MTAAGEPPKPKGLSRDEVARILGLSRSSIFNLERRGELSYVLGAAGEHVYDETFVRELAKRRAGDVATAASAQRAREREARGEDIQDDEAPPRAPTVRKRPPVNQPTSPRRAPMTPYDDKAEGERAARVFAAFDEKKKPRQVVIEQKLPPEIVGALYEQWAKLGELLVIGEDEWAALEQIEGFRRQGPRPTTSQGLIDAIEATLVNRCEHCNSRIAKSCRRCSTEATKREVEHALEAQAADWAGRTAPALPTGG